MTMTILKRTSIVLAASAVAASGAAAVALARNSDPTLVIAAAGIAALVVAGGLVALGYALLEARRQRMAASIGSRLGRALGQQEGATPQHLMPVRAANDDHARLAA